MKTKFFKNAKVIAKTLDAVNNGAPISRYLAEQLVELGYMNRGLQPKAIRTRGRLKVVYFVSGKGRGLIALSKNWV